MPPSGLRVPRPAGAPSAAPSPRAHAHRAATVQAHSYTDTVPTGQDGRGRAAHVVPAGGARPLQGAPAAPGGATGPGATEGPAPQLPLGQARLCAPEKEPADQLGHRHGRRPLDAGHTLSAQSAGALSTRAAQRGPRAGGKRSRGLSLQEQPADTGTGTGASGQCPETRMPGLGAPLKRRAGQGKPVAGRSEPGRQQPRDSTAPAHEERTRPSPGASLCVAPGGEPETQHPPRRSPWRRGEAMGRESHSINTGVPGGAQKTGKRKGEPACKQVCRARRARWAPQPFALR